MRSYLLYFRDISIRSSERRSVALAEHWLIYRGMKTNNIAQIKMITQEHLDHSLQFILAEMERQKLDEQLLTISSYAETALYEEVALSPKPGLVDRFSNGAHRDMDFQTFLASIQSLRPFFKEYLYLGLTHRGQPSSLFDSLRETGKMAETAMLKSNKRNQYT